MVPLEPRRVSLDKAAGCVLAEEVEAAEDVPPFANSAMDGFAVRCEDAREDMARLHLVGAVTAGGVAAGPLGPGEAMAIATGAPLPKGSDAVCMVERTTLEGTEVVLEVAVVAGENVRYAGEDIPPRLERLRPEHGPRAVPHRRAGQHRGVRGRCPPEGAGGRGGDR